MNIGLFTDTYFPQINGVGTSVHTLAEELRKRGHRVYIFTTTDPNVTTDETDVIRMPSMPCFLIRQYRIGLLYSPKALNKIAHLQLDIIHTQTEFSLGLFGKILSKALNLPMVHTYHTMYEDYIHYIVNGALVTPAMAKEFSKIFCNSANAVIAPTEKVKHFLLQYGVTKPIAVIPTGIRLDKFRRSNYPPEETQKLKQSLGIPLNCPIILSLGRIAHEKSIDVVLKALPALRKRLPEARMVIVGDGPEREILEQLSENLGIADMVLFTGAKPWDEIGRYYQLGTVFVSASVTETQGLTFAEAMAGGIPVVAKKDPSIEGIVIDGKTGVLFEKDEELSQKLYEILTDTEKQSIYSKNSMETIETLSAESFAAHAEALYQDVLANPVKYDFHRHTGVRNKTVHKIEAIRKEVVREVLKTRRKIASFSNTPQRLRHFHYFERIKSPQKSEAKQERSQQLWYQKK